MELLLVGLHQRTAPLALRERLAFSPEDAQRALDHLREHAQEGFILSTCNRVEVYALLPAGAASLETVAGCLAAWRGLDPAALRPHLYGQWGGGAVRHLFRVAAGLDSMVLGEDQILGQVKAAAALARRAGGLGPRLGRLVDQALAAGKRVRTETGLGRNRLSVVSVGLEAARRELGGLAARRVAVVGAGRMAALVLQHLANEPLRSRVVLNRTPERAAVLATSFGAEAWPLDALAEAVREADLIVTCTAAPTTVVSRALVAAAGRPGARPLLFLDLAVPRDVEPAVASLPGVRVLDVDALQEVCAANRALRAAEIARAEALVEAEVEKFLAWWAAQEVVPTIRALRARAEAIRAAELERTLARLSHLDPQERQAIQALSAAIVNKLLHRPIATLKEPSGGELVPAVERLFRLRDA